MGNLTTSARLHIPTLPALKAVQEEYLLAITQAIQRVERLDDLIAAQVPAWRLYPAVQALMCLRGFQLTVAIGG